MDLINGIKELGLPAWVVISAAILVILRTIGLLDPLISFFRGLFGIVRERVEASVATERTEQIAVWKQLTDLQSQALSENRLLLEYIIDDIKTMLEDILAEVRQEKYHVRGVESKLTLLIQIISEWYDKRRKLEDERDNRTTQKAFSESDNE